MKNILKKMFAVLLVTHEQASAGCARGSRALRGTLLLALTFGLALGASAENRSPDYTTADGNDWMYNHAIGTNATYAAKKYAGEPAADSGVDLFYVYPTLAGDEKIVIDGFRGIDDATMRGDTVPSKSTAKGAFHGNGRCFADMMHVYAPYYRQSSITKAMDCATNEVGGVRKDANARYLKALYEGPAYADVTNALSVYFAKWNNGRKFMLAGHSQGSAILRLVMENYFTLSENREKAKLLIASYQIGFGASKAKVDEITEKTGVTFATNATDVGVIVSFNTFGPGGPGQVGSPDVSGPSILLPDDAIAINPLTWTTNATPADKTLNLGALTNEVPERIVAGLYGATVSARGVVECAEFTANNYIGAVIFGEKSLHGQDYAAFWEDLHKNAYDRITAATGRAPLVGQPKDYADKANWMAFGDTDKTGKTDKPFDIFYAYPTSTASMNDYVADVDDYMLKQVSTSYRQNLGGLESYANVYVPYHRQLSVGGLTATKTADGQQQNLARHVVKTDLFAALDYYFANANVGGARPFVLVGHSQGAADLKNILEQYFIGEKKAYLAKLIATYAVGWTFSSDWCKEYGYTFATGASDTNVLIGFEAEGPDIVRGTNMLTTDPKGLAINPLNWTTNTTYAPITENLGSYKNGECIPGGADGQLDPVNRPGALIVTNTVFDYNIEAIYGKESYHQDEFAMFRGNICDNILARGKNMTGYCKLCTTNWPAHLCVSNGYYTTESDSTKNWVEPVGGTVWIPTNDLKKAIAYLVPEKGYRMFVDGVEKFFIEDYFDAGALNADGEFMHGFDQEITFEWIQRAPDYADATGKDWLFYSGKDGKTYEGEPTDDPGVDLFYLYPTCVTPTNREDCVDMICDIDDPGLRGLDFSQGSYGARIVWEITGKVFGDYTRVYAPYYRQTPTDFEDKIGAEMPENGNRYLAEYWYNHAPYTDVTNALTHYFTVINPNGKRPFIFAGHSHGAGMLQLAMERFFTNETQKAWLKNMVACYAVGFGMNADVEKTIREKAGVPFATNATDTGVYIMWNTQGPDASGNPGLLWPPNAVASVNPILWTRDAACATSNRNLGAWTTNSSVLGKVSILPGLYDASNNVASGTVVCTSEALASSYITASGYGEKSLHGWDYKAYWDNIRANGLQRIATWKAANGVALHSQIPLVGQPIDYSDAFNWVTNSITATGVKFDADAIFFYPTLEMSGDSTFMPVTDAHKATAHTWYANNVKAFEGYANIIMPAYRQMNMAAVTAGQTLYPTGSEFFEFLRRTTSRTDLFAALDYYFTAINPDGKRPFFFAGHSQGSAQIKVLLQDYFTRDENQTKLDGLIAAYALGYSFDAKWIAGLGVGLKAAEGETDTKVVVSWNTEGTNAVEHSFVVEDGAIAINPMNWTTNVNVWSGTLLGAMIQQRTGYADGTYVLVTTNSTDFVPESMGMGERSLHTKDWSLWFEQIKANGYARMCAIASPGSKLRPWLIGETIDDDVTAWTNGQGTLVIEGAGRMMHFAADGTEIPWTTSEIAAVTLSSGVTQVGTNAWYGLGDGVTYNGISSAAVKTLASGFGGSLGYASTQFKAVQSADGIFSMAVALETAPSLTNDWTKIMLQPADVSIDDNGRIIIKHDTGTNQQGFYVIQPSK